MSTACLEQKEDIAYFQLVSNLLQNLPQLGHDTYRGHHSRSPICSVST